MPVVEISSPAELATTLAASRIVVADFYATWCGPCKVIAPVFATLSENLSAAGKVTFVKIDTDQQREIAATYDVTAMPTFVLFRDGNEIDRVRGADRAKLHDLVKRITSEAGASSSSSSAPAVWHGASIPRGYVDLSENIEVTRTELLNVDDAPGAGTVRVLFDKAAPTLAETPADGAAADWVESDTDEQLMLFVPLQSIAKLHTLQITARAAGDAARPQLLKLYCNSPHNLGFDEAEAMEPTQEIALAPGDWNDQATVSIPLRFVKFQRTTSLVVFVVAAEDGADKVRLDRVRLIGDAGEKREMGQLQKIDDE